MVGGIGGPGGGGKIGGPGATPPAPTGKDRTESTTGATFKESIKESVESKGKEPIGATSGAAGASPLERLRSGEIDLKTYVEIRVQSAISHLEGVLPPADLEKVRAELQDTIEQDPDVAALVKAAEVGR